MEPALLRSTIGKMKYGKNDKNVLDHKSKAFKKVYDLRNNEKQIISRHYFPLGPLKIMQREKIKFWKFKKKKDKRKSNVVYDCVNCQMKHKKNFKR